MGGVDSARTRKPTTTQTAARQRPRPTSLGAVPSTDSDLSSSRTGASPRSPIARGVRSIQAARRSQGRSGKTSRDRRHRTYVRRLDPLEPPSVTTSSTHPVEKVAMVSATSQTTVVGFQAKRNQSASEVQANSDRWSSSIQASSLRLTIVDQKPGNRGRLEPGETPTGSGRLRRTLGKSKDVGTEHQRCSSRTRLRDSIAHASLSRACPALGEAGDRCAFRYESWTRVS